MKFLKPSVVLVAMILPGSAALAQSCSNRGQLDEIYCDAERDLVADVPMDKSISGPHCLSSS